MHKFVWILLVGLLAISTDAYACKPAPYPSFAAETANAEIIFKGRVVRIEGNTKQNLREPPTKYKAWIQVLEIKKGKIGDVIEAVYASSVTGSCDMQLGTGQVDWFQMRNGNTPMIVRTKPN